jgi:hypothetical protein
VVGIALRVVGITPVFVLIAAISTTSAAGFAAVVLRRHRRRQATSPVTPQV